MSWDNIGYNENLTRSENLPTDTQELDPLQFEQFAPEFSGSKLSGVLSSQDGRVKLDLDNNTIIISDGVVERVRLGRQSDDSYGIIIKDKNGNTLMQFNDARQIIQVGSENVQIDFDNEYILISEGGIGRVLLGKDLGGF